MEDLAGSAATLRRSNVRRKPHAERCKLGRSLAGYWMSLGVVIAPHNKSSATLNVLPPPIGRGGVAGKNQPEHNTPGTSFLDALKKPAQVPVAPLHSSSTTNIPPATSSMNSNSSKGSTSPPLQPVTSTSPLPSGGQQLPLTPLVPIDDCLQSTILSILKDIAVAGAMLPESTVPIASSSVSAAMSTRGSNGGATSSHSCGGDTQRCSPSSYQQSAAPVSSHHQMPSTPPAVVTKRGNKKVMKDPDVMYWKEIKVKLLHLRTQIRNRDEFDLGLVQCFGDEWLKTLHDGSVEDDSDEQSQGEDSSLCTSLTGTDDGHFDGHTQAAAAAVPAASSSRKTPGSTAPPSPICLQPNDGDVERSFAARVGAAGTSPPPPPGLEAVKLGDSASPTPAVLLRSPKTMAANGGGCVTPPLRPRQSPPPQLGQSQGSNTGGGGGGANGVSPVTTPASTRPGYHLESRDEMLRRRNNSLGGSTTTNPFNSSLGAFPAVPNNSVVGGNATPKSRSLSNSPLIGPMLATGSASSMPGLAGMTAGLCPFDYIMVLDFEATCDEPTPPNFLHEIIEFPVVVVDVQARRVCMEFHSFVRPLVNPVLSHFCTQLTGIRQEDVDAAPTLPEVIRRFEAWLKNSMPPHARVIFATDGPWDMRDFMYNHSFKRQGIPFPQVFFQWIDVKTAFANFFHCPRQRIVKMLEYLGLMLEGRLHSGLDDSRNIAKIVIGLLIRGCSMCDLDRIPYIGAPASIDNSNNNNSSSACSS